MIESLYLLLAFICKVCISYLKIYHHYHYYNFIDIFNFNFEILTLILVTDQNVILKMPKCFQQKAKWLTWFFCSHSPQRMETRQWPLHVL